MVLLQLLEAILLIKRREINDLQSWSERLARKPLLIRGARQVGKTTLVTLWAQAGPLKLLAVNFERNPGFPSTDTGGRTSWRSDA